MYEHLLVALDGSPAAERVLDHAEALAKAFGSTITLLRATVSAEMIIAETTPGDLAVGQVSAPLETDPVVTADRDSAEAYLARVASRLRQHNLTVNVEHTQGPANQVIVDRAAALGVGLIVMTTHGRSGLSRMVFGSVADSVLRHATCPVLLVRISDTDGAPSVAPV